MKRIFHTFLLLLGIAGLSLIASLPLWLTPGLPNSDDSLTHVFNLFAFDRQIHAGLWYPLRFPDHGLAYGYAVPSYYPPLPYLLLELTRLAGAGYVLSFKLGLALMILLAGWSSFALGRSLFGVRAGWVTALVYLFSPYLLANAHLRGALAEQLGLAVGPLLFLVLFHLLQRPGWTTFLAASAVVALLLCTHFLSTLLYLPFALLYTLWVVATPGQKDRWRRLGWSVAAALAGALLTAFYWLPAALEQGGLKQVEMATALAEYVGELFTPAQLLRPVPLITYSNIHGMPELGLPFLLLIGLALLSLLAGWSRWSISERSQWLFFGLAALLALVLSSTLAAPLWQQIQAVALIQFPFRWLGPAALFLAVFIGAAAQGLPGHQRTERTLALVMGGVLIWYGVASLWKLPHEPAMLRSLGVNTVSENEINLAGLRGFEYDQADNLRENCWVWAYEYVPRTSALSACAAMRDLILDSQPLAADLPAVEAQIQPQRLTADRMDAEVTASQPFTLSLHAFWLPGWQATVDGQPAAVEPVGSLGLAGVAIPAGQHTVSLQHGLTGLRQASAGLSLLVLLLWLAAALWWRPRLAITVALLLGLLVAPPRWTALHAPAPPPWQETAVEFGGAIALQGYGLAVEGNQLRLDLAWLTRQDLAASYKVFVHLIDDTGKLWAQDDSRPLHYASNTNRWLPGQLLADQHELLLPEGLPAGSYQLRIGLYNEADGVRLPVLDGEGKTIDDQWLLAHVTLPPE